MAEAPGRTLDDLYDPGVQPTAGQGAAEVRRQATVGQVRGFAGNSVGAGRLAELAGPHRSRALTTEELDLERLQGWLAWLLSERC